MFTKGQFACALTVLIGYGSFPICSLWAVILPACAVFLLHTAKLVSSVFYKGCYTFETGEVWNESDKLRVKRERDLPIVFIFLPLCILRTNFHYFQTDRKYYRIYFFFYFVTPSYFNFFAVHELRHASKK